MNDRELDALVRGLPRPGAGPGFAARVVRAARQSQRPRGRGRLALAGVALAAAVLVTTGVLERRHAERQRAALAAEVRALRAAVGELEAGLGAPPLVYVGGDDRVDIVVDGRRFPPGAAHAAAEPALSRGEEL